MASDHLKVDLTELGSCADALAQLKDEFEHAGERAEGAHHAVGNRHLIDALDDFVKNSKYHRQKLVENLESVQKMAEAGHQTYTEVDCQLATSLTSPSPSAGGGGAGAAGHGRAQ